ncbi:MAG: ABC transporter substrate-binding protein, partial [Burkholderiaceae bacterium]|nr:ABC transporter substrate-binding protein [Burkholderiaceae bacterium]
NPTFLGSTAAYSDIISKLGGKPVDGLYATMTVVNPYLDDDSPPVRAWANKYKARFNEEPSTYSVYGYLAGDVFAMGVQKAGANLTTDSFIQVMDSMTVPPDIFGLPAMRFSATQRLGAEKARLSQIQNGRWKVVSDYF